MDKPALEKLLEGAALLGMELGPVAGQQLLSLRDLLLKWNAKVNLTAIVDPLEVLEKHFLDSLAIQSEVGGAASLLDIGSGAGLPGLPLKIARPQLTVVMVESVGKKVGFVKQAIATLGLKGATAVQRHAEGQPEREGLALADRVVSRALTDLATWVPLARHYLAPGGKVIAMLAQLPPASTEALLEAGGMRKVSERSYRLPWSQDPRCVLSFECST